LQRDADKEDQLYGLQEAYESKSIFFHIPKTAGMSIAYALWGRPGALHLRPEHAKLIFGWWNFQRFFKFGFVRNPYDRVVSAWSFLKQGGLHKWKSQWVKEHIDPPDFLQFVKERLPTKNIISDLHFLPQYLFLTDHADKFVTDFIGYYENLDHDFAFIASTLGITPSKLTKNNTSDRCRDLRYYYDKEAADKVYSIYRKDFTLFGYSKDIPHQ
jgi:hypothetical protein